MTSLLAVFVSGSGTNLQAIIDAVQGGSLPAEVRVVISDKKEAYGLERARLAGIEALAISPKEFPSREKFDSTLLKAVQERKIDWVILAGFMRILTPAFLRPLVGRVINIHPALLPNYPGTHAIERAFAAGEREVGVTVHFVDEGVDTGPIIAQEKLAVRAGESLDELTERIHALEHRLYPGAIRELVKGKVSVKGATR
ncbi:MAG: phosphoribosylglycinamide formyltransferase [Pseudomonadota bacterium]